MYQVAQLYFMQERYREALDRLELWFCKSPPEKIKSQGYVLKASIHSQMEQFREALRAIEAAIAMDEEPEEQWYQLKLAAHYELEQYPLAAETLEVMISLWPERKLYWSQLSQIYFKLKQDEKALAVMALAHHRNMLDKQADITFLANLYGNANIPFKAAEVLNKGIEDGIVAPTREHWSIMADHWYAAEELESALSAYEVAGQASSDGAIDLRRGYILIDLERWPDALAALDNALNKGGLDEHKTAEAFLLRGVAHFNLEEYDRASSDWVRASRHERSKDAAQQWINHLREERRRQAS
jgi:tetratricopeptide (TPR) repeat protein